MKKLFLALLIVSILLGGLTSWVTAQSEAPSKIKGYINSKESSTCEAFDGEEEDCIIFEVTNENEEKFEIIIPADDLGNPLFAKLNKGDQVFLRGYSIGDNEYSYIIDGPVRNIPLLFLTLVFVISTVIVGGIQGFGSLVGLGVSIAILFTVTTPMILNGSNPILAGYMGGLLVLIFSIFLSHGFNRKTIIALLSTIIGLFITSIITLIFINFTKLTGYGSEDAFFLMSQSKNQLNMTGVLFASIIIGGIGVIDDITVNQVSVIQEFLKTNPGMTWQQVYKKAMNVGKDHVAAMVNTLFLAYAGASMPIVMLLQANNLKFEDIINAEAFSEEIVRTLVSSTGLILIVPISTLFASIFMKKYITYNKFK